MENNYLEKYAIEQLRLQRHDFMNYLQVIYGYIQINKPQEAISYIKNINKYMTVIAKIFNLECDALGMLFQEFINKCMKLKIEIELYIGIEYISCEHFSKDIDRKKRIFEMATDKLLDKVSSIENYRQKLHIYFNGLPESFSILISNAEILDEEDYFDSVPSKFSYEDIEAMDESCVFLQSNGITTLKLIFK